MLNQITCRSLTFLFALADKQHDLSDPTAWTYFANADSAALNAQIDLGYRNRQRFRDAIMFHLGGLDLYPQTASTHTDS